MKKYIVKIQRAYDTEIEVEAKDEIEAEEKAQDKYDEIEINGIEMYKLNCEVNEIE